MADERPKKMRRTGRALTQQELSPQKQLSPNRLALDTAVVMDSDTDMDMGIMDTMDTDPKTLPSIVTEGQPVEVFQAGGQFSVQGSVSRSAPSSSTDSSDDEDSEDSGPQDSSTTSHNLRSPQPRHKNYPNLLGIQGPDDHKQYNNNYHDGIEQTRLQLDQWSQVSDRGLGLEGKHIARVAPTMQPTSYPLALSAGYLIERVKTDLEPNISVFFPQSEKYFLPLTVLHKVLSTGTVLRLLQILSQDRSELDLVELANKIAPPLSSLSTGDGINKQYRRTFATLILGRLENMIFDFVEAALDDEELLKIEVTLEGQVKLDGITPPPPLGTLFSSEDWSVEKIKSFKRLRWELSPTFVAAKWEPGAGGDEADTTELPKRVRYQLRSIEEVLPFEPADREPITGGFSEVRFFSLHKDQQGLDRYTRREKDNHIAVKTLNNYRKGSNEQQRAYIDEVYVMERLASTISSPHISKLLATIEVPRAVSHQQRSDYHLIMEAADRSLDKLWGSKEWWATWWKTRSENDTHLAKWVSRQCYGLADALSKLHDFPKQSGDINDKTHGLHCDIKPENILHYECWKLNSSDVPGGTVDEELGVLQLSDFGLSSFHSTMSVENQRVVGNSLDYAAPETDFLLTRSPAADVWHLGCLFMDFASWLVEGPEGYEGFCKSRLTDVLRGRMCRFATFTSNKKAKKETTAEVNLKVLEVRPQPVTIANVVSTDLANAYQQHATYLCSHDRSSEFVQELCHLAVNYMLVMRDPNQTQERAEYSSKWCRGREVEDRLTSSQVTKILERMVARDDSYFERSNVGADFVPFEDHRWKRPRLVFNVSVQQLQTISRKVKSGLDLEETGLKPSVTVVKGSVET
ncbi:hypothetical protein B0H67DRAFT_569393 [Lasiosphaeris hirsuta]|uniref:Protein kinase domain-containing protein n=1 Tax=Lasiosphaeris hirsuta TaxID=260670 RepID=A0AA40AZW0_9PEZI|nr:hypothetical protein B0H67DRAFT_569393 [Lasiosphaeris hirsuta]